MSRTTSEQPVFEIGVVYRKLFDILAADPSTADHPRLTPAARTAVSHGVSIGS